MALTSGALQLLLAGVTALAFAVTVWLWPKLSQQRPVPIAARLGLIVTGQILLTATVLVYVNAIFTFYGNWSELLGTGNAAAATVSRPSDTTTSVPRPALRQLVLVTGANAGTIFGAAGTALPINQVVVAPGHDLAASLGGGGVTAGVTNGLVLRITLVGQYTGIVSSNNYMYLPPQYFESAYASAKFPVVMAFTGYPNDTFNLMRLLQLPATAADLTSSGKMGPAILLMLNPSVALPTDTECANVPGGLQVATFFGKDVPLAIERSFRAQSARTGWSAMGYSTGAYCSVKLAMLFPEQFSAAVGLSGYYNAELDQFTGPSLYGHSVPYQLENNLNWRLQHLPAPAVSILLATSNQGERSKPGTLLFLSLIRPPMQGSELLLPSGGHNYRTWRRELPRSLEWLSKLLTPAGPVIQPAGTPASATG